MTNDSLKAQAKRLRSAIAEVLRIQVSTSQSLELISKFHNFPHWDAASASSKRTTLQSLPNSSPCPTASDFIKPPENTGQIIVATPGSGKNVHVTSAIIDRLRIGKTIVVIDSGQSYYKLTQALGGIYCFLQSPSCEKLCFGDARLIVYDAQRIAHQPTWPHSLPGIPPELFSHEGFLVIDECATITSTIPEVLHLQRQALNHGASFMAIGQSDESIRPFFGPHHKLNNLSFMRLDLSLRSSFNSQ